MRAHLEGYLERLRDLPFVRSVSVDKEHVEVHGAGVDAVLSIRTPTGKKRIYCKVTTSNLSNELAAQAIGLGVRVKPLLVVAPVIGAGIGAFLAAHETSFLDLRGNCYVDLGGRYIAHVQGRGGDRPAVARALRTPSYQVLFTVLADPTLISAPVRTLAAAAEVSRQPVTTLRARLLELELIVRANKSYAWTPAGATRALELWLAGYATTVRPSLLVGCYRTQDADPSALETRIAPILDRSCRWRWGGGAAAYRLTKYFRGERTVVHVIDEPHDLHKRLRAVPDRNGPLVLIRSPGPAGLDGNNAETAHPLLVYTELLTDGSDRAREAAQVIGDRFAIGKAP